MAEQQEESLISHLEELRGTLIRCLTSVAIVLPFAFYFSPKVLDFLIETIIGNNNITLNFFSPVEVFLIQIKVAIVIAVIICFPYLARQVWLFLLPALYENEKNFIKSVVVISSSLFLCGVAFCIFMILPWIIKFGMSFATSNITAVFGIANIVSLTLWLSLAFGVMFQMPLITYSLIKSGIVSYETISDKRRYVVVLLLVLAATLTPPDVISQIMLFVPTYLLFEAGLFFARKYRKKEEENSAE